MKKLIFISALIVFGFSCKKEKLEGEKEIFIGTWELRFAVESIVSPPTSWRTIYPSSPTTTLTFQKNGEVLFFHDGEETKYKMNFKKKNGGQFKKGCKLFEQYANKDTGRVYLGEHLLFTTSFHNGSGDVNRTTILGSIGSGWLRIESSSKIISTYSYNYLGSYTNYFKKIN